MKTTKCIVCQKEIEKIGNVKYCSQECATKYAESLGVNRIDRDANREACLKYKAKNREKIRIMKYAGRLRLKHEVLSHYSSGTPCCSRCGETDVDMLVLDHINDDGAEQRKELGVAGRGVKNGWRGGHETYKKMGFPEGLQVLCANCNTKKEIVRKREQKTGTEHYDHYITNNEEFSWIKPY